MPVGQKVRLRPVTSSDLPLFVGWFEDAEVRRHLLLDREMSIEEEQAWFAAVGSGKSPSDQVFTIDERQGEIWRPIGACALHKIDLRHGRAEAGINLGERSRWGQGLGTEAMELLVAWGFGERRLNRIELEVFAGHEPARRCYQKVGFVDEGLLRQRVFRHGQYLDVHLMALLADDWRARRG